MNVDLRCFLIFVFLLVLMGCGVQSEKEAITAIKELGGNVKLGSDNRVNLVTFLYSKNTDSELNLLKWCPKLEILLLDGSQVSDAGLVHLKGLTELRCLTLRETQITDVGLVYLKGLTKACNAKQTKAARDIRNNFDIGEPSATFQANAGTREYYGRTDVKASRFRQS